MYQKRSGFEFYFVTQLLQPRIDLPFSRGGVGFFQNIGQTFFRPI